MKSPSPPIRIYMKSWPYYQSRYFSQLLEVSIERLRRGSTPTWNAHSSGHLVQSHLAPAYVLLVEINPFWYTTFQLFRLLCLAKDHWWGFGTQSAPWSILLIKSAIQCCIDLSRSPVLYFNYLVGVTAHGLLSPRKHVQPKSTIDFGWFAVF